MPRKLQKMMIMMMLLVCMRAGCTCREAADLPAEGGQGVSRRHGLSVWCGLSGTGVRVSAGSPGPLRKEAARPWPCLSGLSVSQTPAQGFRQPYAHLTGCPGRS